MITALQGDMRRLARVVYCQRLPDGHFAVGFEFQGSALKWGVESFAGTILAAVFAIFFPGFVIWEPAPSAVESLR